MRGLLGFLRSTVLGGVFVLLPLVVVGAFAVWAVEAVVTAVRPVIGWLPVQSVGGVSLALLAAVLGVVGCCFLAGMLAETALVRGLGRRAERLALSVPGYALMKNVGASMVGVDGHATVRTVVVRFEGHSQIGFLTDTLPDGLHVVFVPGVPGALVGTLHLVSPDRVREVDVPVSAAMDALGRLGVGLREVWPTVSATTVSGRPAG